jgi:hypothetical protein
VREFREAFCGTTHAAEKHLCADALAINQVLDPSYTPPRSVAGFVAEDQEAIRAWAAPFDRTDPEMSSKASAMVQFYIRHYSPLSRIPIQPVLARLEGCLQRVEDTKPEYGSCLLNRILMEESAADKKTETLVSSAKEYVSWYEHNQRNLASRPDLGQARDRLANVIGSAAK